MKKKYIIAIIIIALLVAIILGFILFNKEKQNDKNYEIEQIKQYNYFVLKQQELYGVIDNKGNIIIEPNYSEVKIPNPEKGVFVCYQGDNTKVYNERKEEILTQYNNVQPIRLKNISSDLMYEKSVLQYKKDEKYGLIQLDGKEIVKPIYDEIDSLPYKEGELLVKQNGKYGVINIKGAKRIEIKYDKIAVDEYYTDENRYQFAGYIISITTQEGYRYGYLDNKTREILKTEYNEISRVTELEEKENSYLICAKNGQYGMMKNEELILNNEYQSIRYDATNKIFVVEKSKKYGIADLNGKIIVPIQYNQIDITGIYIYAQNEQGIAVYDTKGEVVDLDPNIAILNTGNEKYKIKINNQTTTLYGLINKEGEQLIEEKYSYIQYLYDNYFIVSNENGKLGIVDDKDLVKIEINKDSLQKIQDTNLLQATLEDKTIQIYDKNMNLICQMPNAIIEIENDTIKIYNQTETKYFNKEGKEVENTQVYPNNKLYTNVKEEQYGFINKNGEQVIDYKYDRAFEFNKYGFAAVKKDGKWGVIDEQGKELIEPTYELEEQKTPFFIGKYYRVIYGLGEIYYTDAK